MTMYLEIGLTGRHSSPGTYPIVLVIVSPGSKIGHTPRKNPSITIAIAATSRIIAYRGLRRLLAFICTSLSQPRIIIPHDSGRCKYFFYIFIFF